MDFDTWAKQLADDIAKPKTEPEPEREFDCETCENTGYVWGSTGGCNTGPYTVAMTCFDCSCGSVVDDSELEAAYIDAGLDVPYKP